MAPKKPAVPAAQKKVKTRRCEGCTFTKRFIPYTDNSCHSLETWETTDDRGHRVAIIPREDDPWSGPWVVVVNTPTMGRIFLEARFHGPQGERDAFLFAALFVKGHKI